MIIGHQKILNLLKKSIKNNRVSHAYLFTGPSHLGKKTVALEFIKMLNGEVNIIEPESTTITIKQIREVKHQMEMSSQAGNYKIALIDQAEKMNPQAGNCLLKTLEEPQGKAVLILISSKPKYILPTIISRCQLINFPPVREEEIKKTIKNKKILCLANGRPGLALNYLNNPDLLEEKNKIISKLEEILKGGICERYEYAQDLAQDNIKTQDILEDWMLWFRDLILLKTGNSDLVINNINNNYNNYSLIKLNTIIKAIKKTSSLISNPSFNARLALEALMLEL